MLLLLQYILPEYLPGSLNAGSGFETFPWRKNEFKILRIIYWLVCETHHFSSWYLPLSHAYISLEKWRSRQTFLGSWSSTIISTSFFFRDTLSWNHLFLVRRKGKYPPIRHFQDLFKRSWDIFHRFLKKLPSGCPFLKIFGYKFLLRYW